MNLKALLARTLRTVASLLDKGKDNHGGPIGPPPPGARSFGGTRSATSLPRR
jgi:hypothetical protein